MRRAFRIGLHARGDAAAGWARILRQEKLPWDAVEGPERPVILFDGHLPSWCERYVEQGGVALITGAPAAGDLLGHSSAATLTRFRGPGRDRDAVLPCLARIFEGEGEGEIRLHENRKPKSGQLADIRPAVLVRPHGRGWFIYTGLPLATHLMATGDGLRACSDASNVTERIANVDKAELADAMVWMLATALAKLGLPYVRLARFPERARSVFLFRVDVDGLFGTRCRALAEVAQAHGVRGSFYFNASLCRSHPGELSRDWLGTHEIANHADVHDLFDGVDANRANLQAGLRWLEESLGVRTTGYVAPRGLWNEALDRAMAELGLLYSSDFGLDIDSLPFFTPAGLLQVPVHPFSAERLAVHQEDAGFGPPSPRSVLDHYLSALERQVALRRPAHLYGHPEVLGRMADMVLPELFAAVRRLGLPNMTVGAYAAWWRERDKAELALFVDEAGRLEVEAAWDVALRSDRADAALVNGRPHRLEPGRWTVLQGLEASA
jgi:peptidoglycan/xylan/chitin deacetylase (PgdA/CDA1 family)